MADSDRFVMVGSTDHPHEQEGIAFLRDNLPKSDSINAFALLELLDRPTGRLYEIDVLIIGYGAIYLVEMKHYGGQLAGDENGWQWTPEGSPRSFERDCPYSVTNHKAKVLKSRLEQVIDRSRGVVPFVQPLIFLSNAHLDNKLSGRTAVVGRGGVIQAITHAKVPNVDTSRFRQIPGPMRRELLKAFNTIGIKGRKGRLRAGQYVLGSVLEEGPGYQDREAHHEELQNIMQRARAYLVPMQTTAEHRQRLSRAAEREVQLLNSVRDCQGILRWTSYVRDAPLGPTLLFEDFEGGIRLDRFLAREPLLSFDDRLELLKQIAYALHQCHRRSVHHGGLCPEAVLVRRREGKLEAKLYNFLLGSSDDFSPTQHRTALAELMAQPGRLYQAPELDHDPTLASPSTDTFSLGALAYRLFTHEAPAATPVELSQKLQRDQSLDPLAVRDDLPAGLAEAITEATRLENRIDSPLDLIELLVDRLNAERARANEPVPDSTENVLEAEKGALLIERFEVQRVLGMGASARVLEVLDHEDGNHYALKVARDADQDERLLMEAAALRELDDPRIVKLHAELEIQGRTCLLLSLAGDRSLQQLLAEEGTLDLDLAARYGEDLLRALEALEEKDGTIHRDIKPANLGVGIRRKGLARHLTLFDFSLASAARNDLDVGTRLYRDPYLKTEGRGVWDHAADRWSAAITLHEMLTGVRPEFSPRGISPLATHAKLEVMAERFDAANRDRLIRFFEKAFARDVNERFSSAAAMTRSWAACFDEIVRVVPPPATAPTPTPGVDAAEPSPARFGPFTAEQLEKIRRDTEIRALPLGARALNALDRAGLHVAEELLSLPNNRLSAIRGVGSKVLGEILDLRNRWRKHLGEREDSPPPEPFYSNYHGPDLELASFAELDTRVVAGLEDAGLRTTAPLARAAKQQVEAVIERNGGDPQRVRALLASLESEGPSDAGPTTLEGWIAAIFPSDDKAASRRLRMLYGLEAPFLGVTTARAQDIADHEGLTRQRMHQILAEAIQRWQAQPWRDALRALAVEVVESLHGVTPLDDACQALRSRVPYESETSPALLEARLAALLRVACELGSEGSRRGVELRRRERGPEGASRSVLWLLSNPEHWVQIENLGRRADRLAAREPLAASGETQRYLAEAVQGHHLDVERIGASRLLELAATASRLAARSSRLELYPIGMAPERALELSAQALSAGLTPEQIVHRVRSRYPEAQPLPPRPALDELLAAHQLQWVEAEGKYQRAFELSEATSITSTVPLQRHDTTQPSKRVRSEGALVAGEFEDLLRAVQQDRKLRVLGVNAAHLPEALRSLERVLGTRAIALDQRLILEMERLITAKNGKLHAFWRIDAAGPDPNPRNWQILLTVAEQAAERLAAELLPPREPLLLIQLGLLARYQLHGFLAAIVAAAQDDRSEAIVLVNALHDGDRPDMIANSLAIPGLLSGQVAWVPQQWIENKHRGAALDA